MKKSSSKLGLAFFIFTSLWTIAFLVPPLLAQTTVDVTTNAGDESLNSLGWAVTTLNTSGDGAISINNGSAAITLSQPLSIISINVTLQGQDLNLTGKDDPGSQLLFQQSFNQQDNFTLQNSGAAGVSLDASVTALSWNMASTVFANINGGNAGSTVVTGGLGVLGQNGGGAFATVGFWTAQDSAILTGGAGGSVTDTNGTEDVGGNGGSVGIVGSSLTFSGAQMILSAGNGGSVTDLGSGTPTGGNGGSASVSYGAISLGFGNFGLNGGAGGSGVTGGAGGQSGAVLGTLYLSGGSHFNAQGGLGGNGVSFGGSGGDASVSVGSMTVYSGLFGVEGGAAANSGLSGGNGGSAFVAGGGLTFSSSTVFNITGGQGGNSSGSALGGPANGGNGGDAGVSLASLSMASGSNFNLISGNGGNGGTGTVPGAGGQGGNTSFSIGTYSISGPTQFSSGTGGLGGNSTTGATGGTGGTGGALSVTVGNLTLSSGADLQLSAGNGGSGGTTLSGGNGGAGGNGGNVSFNASSVSMIGTSSTSLVISGGLGGNGGLGASNGSAGTEGQASVSIGNLEGLGNLSVNGTTALLQISSGNFSGDISGSETLQKMGAGTLTLSGSSSYSGGTSVNGGTLVISNDNNLGAAGTTLTLDGATLQTNAGITSSRDVIITTNNAAFNTNGFASSLMGVISGAGGFFIQGQGSLNLTGINTYAGGTTVSGGTLGIASDNSLGAAGTTLTLDGGSLEADGNITSSRNVTITGNNGGFNTNDFASSLSGIISGTGGLSVNGQGSLTLTVANTYDGGTNLAGGTLAVGNSNSLGTGSILVSGGTLESAGSPVSLVIGGNYSQGSGGTLRLGFGGLQAANSDTVTVVGNASLGGTLSLYSYGGLTSPALGNLIYMMLSPSGTLTGTFQQVEEDLGNTRLLPLYYNNTVELESIVPSFLALSSTANEKAIGADLDSTVFNPKLMGMMSQLGPMSSSSLQTAENQISPEGLSALFQAGFEGAASRAALVNQRLSQFKGSQPAPFPGYSQSSTPLFAGLQPVEQEASMALPQHEGGWSGFVSGNGGVFNVASSANAAGYQMTTYGLTGAGADVRLSADFALGLMAGFGQSNIILDGGGTLTAGGGQLGLYGLFASQGFYADGLVEGGISQYSTLRQSYVGVASGQTPGSEWSGAMELGYGWKMKPMTVGPVASLQYTRVGLNGFSETGSVSPLTYPTQSQDSLMSHLGVRADGQWKWGTVNLNPMMTLAWEHEYDNQGGILQAGFGTGDSFAVAGPSIGQDGILAGVGLGVAFSKEFSVAVNYQGELGRTDMTSSQFGGGAQIGF